MFLSNKGQTSIEYLIILTVIFLLSIFFLTSISGTFDINKSIYTIKHKTLELLSKNDSDMILTNIDYSVIDKNISFILNLKQINTDPHPLNLLDYNSSINFLKKTTKFENISIQFNYIN